MSFTSVQYLLFLAAALLVCRSAPMAARGVCILLFSIAFYAAGNLQALIPLAALTLLAYVAGRQLDHMQEGPARRAVSYGSVALLVIVLLLLKDLPKSARPLGWIIPLGISYYTFKLISYILDVTWRKYPAERDLVAFASYSAFFPQITAGPIQRAGDYFQQLRSPHPLTREVLFRAIGRISLGLFKKLVIADQVALILNAVYAGPRQFPGAPLWAAFYFFPIQLYADFSGLSDIAIGSGLLLGIVSPENFDRPFSAPTISEYWRRWHMSLTSWTTDYVFTPLRMAMRNWAEAGLVLSIWLNMMSIALWHGIAWNFVAFGAIHSILVSVDLLTVRKRKQFFKRRPQYDRWTVWLGRLLTFHLVALGLVFWRARTVGDALWLVAHLYMPLTMVASQFAAFTQMDGWRSFTIGICAFALVELCAVLSRLAFPSWDLGQAPRWLRWSFYSVSALALSVGLLLLFVHGSTHAPFLYEIF